MLIEREKCNEAAFAIVTAVRGRKITGGRNMKVRWRGRNFGENHPDLHESP